MSIFGTIGIFRNYIPYPSSVIALARGVIGTLFIFAAMLVMKHKPDVKAIKKKQICLVQS